jgi:hypothetical protein
MEPFLGFGLSPILSSQLAKTRLYLPQKKGEEKKGEQDAKIQH